MQCLRLKFSRGEEVKYISHLSLMRLWERALRRAGISLAYSEGFTPHPRLSLAAPLPIGVTSEAELMDIILQKQVSPYFLIRTMGQQLPRGIDILEVQQISLGAPSLQSQLRYAEYRVEVKVGRSLEEMQAAIVALLRTDRLPWQHMRDTGLRHYDLRALIEHLWVIGWHGSIFTLGMRLRCDSRGSGRPEQVTQAIGLADYPHSIHRTKLLLV
jgi:radical SAM-linked protein